MTRVIALGSRTACDDDAALVAVESMALDADVRLAGRPGPGLVDLLDPAVPTVLVDAIVSDAAPGSIVTLPLAELVDRVQAEASISSHGLGVASALQLGRALGRPLPEGTFIGIIAGQTTPGRGRSAEVDRAIPALQRAIGVTVGQWNSRNRSH